MYTDRDGRSSSLFIYEARGQLGHEPTKQQAWFCLFLVSQDAGSSTDCASLQNTSRLFAKDKLDFERGNNTHDGEYIWGVAANIVRTLELVESNGAKHRVALSADNSFIYNCGATGCVGSLDAYGQGGRLLTAQRLSQLG